MDEIRSPRARSAANAPTGCLSPVVTHLGHVLEAYVDHYDADRSHQGHGVG